MSGTQVIANQGGCTCWCDDCGESHNCENWSRDRILEWLKEHRRQCPIAKNNRINKGIEALANDVPRNLLKPIRVYALSLLRDKLKGE